MKLIENENGLIKDEGGVTIGIQKGQNLGITIVRNSDHQFLTAQLDDNESAKLVSYLGGHKTLYEIIKKSEGLRSDCIDRMEELRDTLKMLVSASEKCCVEFEDDVDSHNAFKALVLAIDVAKKELS